MNDLTPCRQVGDQLRVFCAHCQAIHVFALSESSPPNACAANSLGRELAIELILVSELNDDADLESLAIDIWLLNNGWRQLPMRRWHHALFGSVSLSEAATAQRQLEQLHVFRLEAEAANC